MTVAVAALSFAATGVIASAAATPPPAHNNHTVGRKQVGPLDEANGFPLWYKDTNNVKLELCLDPSDSNCIMGDVPDPTKPVSFPDNSPTRPPVPMTVIGTDAGLVPEPVVVAGFRHGMAERYEIVVDFSAYRGSRSR